MKFILVAVLFLSGCGGYIHTHKKSVEEKCANVFYQAMHRDECKL